MANHKSSIKRIRQTKTRTLHNRYYAKTMRNAVRKLRAMTDKEEAVKLYPSVQKMLDKLAKTNVIHKNKAANLKSSLCKHINKVFASTSTNWDSIINPRNNMGPHLRMMVPFLCLRCPQNHLSLA